MRGQWGGRGGLGGAELGHAYQSPAAYTTGASQTLYQMTGRTPGLSSGGSRASQKRRQERLAKEALERNAQKMVAEAERRAIFSAISQNAANEGSRRGTKRMTANRKNKFKKHFVYGMPIPGFEGNEYKHLSHNEMKNKIKNEALSEYVSMFGNNEGFNEIDLNNNNNNNNNNIYG
jgi:hypothetical protein